MTLQGKKIILGITGSIAAYKSASLVRLLIKAGAEVRVLMTPAATGFITPLSLSTLSKNEVLTQVSSESSWNNHVELGLWADAMLVAPLTATTMAKMAHAICDNMIVATYLSSRCPVFVAPAMDLDMWEHPATLDNLNRLQKFGNHLIPVGHGELASGLVGPGRMAEPEEIVQYVGEFFSKEQMLKGKRALVTAGPTYEPLDPVRFIGNHSSGRMGVEVAEALAAAGAQVDLILGPSKLSASHSNITTHRVQRAVEMFDQAVQLFPSVDMAVMAAAVADYRPAEISGEKIKKKDGDLSIRLVRNPDIAATLGEQKRSNQQIIGFAMETQDEEINAKRKLERKNFDGIVLNSLRDEGAGFGHLTNKVTLYARNGAQTALPLLSKKEVAQQIVQWMVDLST